VSWVTSLDRRGDGRVVIVVVLGVERQLFGNGSSSHVVLIEWVGEVGKKMWRCCRRLRIGGGAQTGEVVEVRASML
jgi:hypothetical protein